MKLEDLLSDSRFTTPEKRAENDDALVEILSRAFQEKPAADWVTLLREAAVPVAPSHTLGDVVRDRHCEETGIFYDHEHPEVGPVRLLGVNPRFSEMSGIIRRPAPLLGEHTEAVLRELGYTQTRIAELRAKGVVFTPKDRKGE